MKRNREQTERKVDRSVLGNKVRKEKIKKMKDRSKKKRELENYRQKKI